ncbi:MAG: hypothetical protein PHH83_02730 [Patescibacteria group bacterium]|nr:hypothetical protein [Patescibacteria group bacterium]
MAKYVKLIDGSKPEEALSLPKGRLTLGVFEVSFTPDKVIDCAKLIIAKGGHDENFYSQAGIIEYAGNNLGWGKGGGYKTI